MLASLAVKSNRVRRHPSGLGPISQLNDADADLELGLGLGVSLSIGDPGMVLDLGELPR